MSKKQYFIAGALLVWFVLLSLMLHLPGNAGDPTFVPLDAISYEEAGQLLLKGQASPIRPWGYALLTALGNGVSQGVIQPLLLGLQVLCWLMTGLFLYRVAARYLKGNWKYLPLIVFALSPSHILFSWLTLTETVFTFLILLAAWLMLRYVQEPGRPRWLIWVNLVLAFACVVRPSLQIPVLVMLLWTGWELWFSKPRRPLVFAAAFTGVFLLIGFQSIRMHKDYGQYTLSFIGKITLYKYLGSLSQSLAENRDLRQVRNERDSVQNHRFTESNAVAYWKQRTAFYDEDFKTQWAEHKGLIFKAWLINLRQNISEPNAILAEMKPRNQVPGFGFIRLVFYKFSAWLNLLMHLLLLPAALILLVWQWIRQRKIFPEGEVLAAAFAALLALFLLLISGISNWQGDRFSMVYYPLILFSLVLLVPKAKNA
jgi:hypothetical protein